MNKIKVYNPYNGNLVGSVKSFNSIDIEQTINTLNGYDFSLSGFDISKILNNAAILLDERKKSFII